MMHYKKGENIEKEMTKESLPFEDCCMPKGQKDFLWMHVKGGTKVTNVINYAKKALDNGEYRTVVWSGSGGGVVKTISCAEILKRSYPLYQVTRMCYTSVEEHWEPQMDGLEEIIANRQIPCLHILMSLDEIDDSVNGLQKPNTITDFWDYQDKETPSASNQRYSQYQRSRQPGNGNAQNRRPRNPRANPQQQQQQHQQKQNQQKAPKSQRQQQNTT